MELREAVKELMAQAIKRKGKAANLALSLYEEYGVEKEGRPYDERTVSTWARPKTSTMPPALALLGAAALTGQSLDQLIYGESILDRLARLERRLDERENSEGAST